MFAAAGSGQRQPARSPRVIDATWTFQVGYFMTMRRGADGVGAAGEMSLGCQTAPAWVISCGR